VVAKNRSIEVSALGQAFKGDLDWIVMKALEKDRSRRYETANAFVLDIKRHLNNEPVSAAAPTFGYQLRKFYPRNRSYMRGGGGVSGIGGGFCRGSGGQGDPRRTRGPQRAKSRAGG